MILDPLLFSMFFPVHDNPPWLWMGVLAMKRVQGVPNQEMVNAYMFFVGFGTPAPGTTIQSVVSRLHFHASSKRNLHKWKWKKHPHDSIGHFWSFLLLVNLAHLISNSTDIHEWKLLGVFLKVGSIRYTLEGSNINISIQIRCFERASLAKAISDPGGQKTILLFLCVWSLLAPTGTVNEGLRMETFGCCF